MGFFLFLFFLFFGLFVFRCRFVGSRIVIWAFDRLKVEVSDLERVLVLIVSFKSGPLKDFDRFFLYPRSPEFNLFLFDPIFDAFDPIEFLLWLLGCKIDESFRIFSLMLRQFSSALLKILSSSFIEKTMPSSGSSTGFSPDSF